MSSEQRMIVIGFLVLSLLVSGCGSSVQMTQSATNLPPTGTTIPTDTLTPTPRPTQTPTVTPTPQPTPTITATPTASPVPLQLDVISDVNAKKVTNLEVIRFEGDETPRQMAFSADGAYLTFVSSYMSKLTTSVSVQNIATGEIVSKMDFPARVAINADGLHVSAYSDGKVRVYEAIGGKVTAEQEIGTVRDADVWFSPDGSYAVIRRGETEFEIWDVKQGASVSVNKMNTSYNFQSAFFSPDNRAVVMINNFEAFVYDMKTGEAMAEIHTKEEKFPIGGGNYFALSPGGATVAIMGAPYPSTNATAGTAVLQLWDGHSGEFIANWNNGVKNSSAREMAFSPDEQWIAYAVRSGSMGTAFVDTTYLFDVKTGKLNRTLAGGWGLAFSQDGRFFASGGTDGAINLWELDKSTRLASLHGHGPQVEGIVFNQGGTLLASRGFDQTIRLWGILTTGVSVARAGVSVSEQGIEFSGLSGYVPSGWLAKGMSPARYQINLTTDVFVVTNCPYTGNHTLHLKGFKVTATITDLENNHVVATHVFPGKYTSGTCPQTYTFVGATAEELIGRADQDAFVAWLKEILVPLGFAP